MKTSELLKILKSMALNLLETVVIMIFTTVQ